MIKKISLNNIRVCFFVALICFLCGCFPGVREETTEFYSLKKLKLKDYPVFDDNLDFKGLNTSIDNSLAYFKRVPFGDIQGFFARGAIC